MKTILIKNALVVNEGEIKSLDVFIKNGRFEKISELINTEADIEINAEGKYLLPGIIDDQVHFREPGLTHKATINSEAKAAVAGGITSFMEMPNTVPNAVTQALLEEKYSIAENSSLANYSFYMGTTNNNLEEVLRTDKRKVCGVKIFMGASTGDMLVDNAETLESIFSRCDALIATHCEHEPSIRHNLQKTRERFGDSISAEYHPIIRDVEVCYLSSNFATGLAKKYGTRLHVLHISTAKELELFDNSIDLSRKRITAEACVHHLWFDAGDYARLGNLIKCNPAIKDASNKVQILQAVLDDRIDVIATDHAPHTSAEKAEQYLKSPAGLPLVQHSLNMMLEFYTQQKISLEKIAIKMSHAVADCFRIEDRGYIREGYFADAVIVDLNQKTEVKRSGILYKCGWSPLEGHTFPSAITHTIVSGHLAFAEGKFDESKKGERLLFNN